MRVYVSRMAGVRNTGGCSTSLYASSDMESIVVAGFRRVGGDVLDSRDRRTDAGVVSAWVLETFFDSVALTSICAAVSHAFRASRLSFSDGIVGDVRIPCASSSAL